MSLVSCPECNSEVSDKAPHCVKCGCPISAPSDKSSVVAQEQPPEGATANAANGRVPCPNCSELVSPSATLCPFCKQVILSKNKGTNAVANIVVSIVIFLVLFYALSAFTRHEADKEYKRISHDAEQETARIMRDAQRQTEEMMRDLQRR